MPLKIWTENVFIISFDVSNVANSRFRFKIFKIRVYQIQILDFKNRKLTLRLFNIGKWTVKMKHLVHRFLKIHYFDWKSNFFKDILKQTQLNTFPVVIKDLNKSKFNLSMNVPRMNNQICYNISYLQNQIWSICCSLFTCLVHCDKKLKKTMLQLNILHIFIIIFNASILLSDLILKIVTMEYILGRWS